ncbi:MAG: hypothetical protein H6718_09575 [Polyangiaceae bacterium]|nr:hypothetical protein [Polyangiaceae bacterium]
MSKKFSPQAASSPPSQASFRLSEPPSFRWFRDLPGMQRPASVPPEADAEERRRLQAKVNSLEEQIANLQRQHLAAIEALEVDYERRLEDRTRHAALQLQRLQSEQREFTQAYQELDLYAARLEADRVGARHAQAQLIGERDRARRDVDELRQLVEQYEIERVARARNPFSEVPGAQDGEYPESAIHRVSSVRQVLRATPSMSEELEPGVQTSVATRRVG